MILQRGFGVSFQQVQKYEQGRNRMSAAMTVQIAAVLKVDVRYFFDELPTGAKNNQSDQNACPRRYVACRPWPSPDRSISQFETDKLRAAVADLATALRAGGHS